MVAVSKKEPKKQKPVKKNKIALTSGDPAGIGPEITLKAFLLLPKSARKRVVLFGDLDHFKKLNRRIKTGVAIASVRDTKPSDDCLRIEPVKTEGVTFASFGKVNKACGIAAMASVEAAADRVMSGEYDALVTAPICKEAAHLAGYQIPGHTEFLAQRAGVSAVVMTLASKELAVALVTTHLPLSKVANGLTIPKVEKTISIVDATLKMYGVKKPRIAICGLNPHASDGGVFGDEEKRIIQPAIVTSRRKKIDITGPYPADTLFSPLSRKKYDVAIAIYHDQGLIPIKALSFGETVNITFGLPYLRVSVDHGTAFDIAGKNRADGKPMAFAIRTTFRLLAGRWIKGASNK